MKSERIANSNSWCCKQSSKVKCHMNDELSGPTSPTLPDSLREPDQPQQNLSLKIDLCKGEKTTSRSLCTNVKRESNKQSTAHQSETTSCQTCLVRATHGSQDPEAGDIIVGLSSSGQASYETAYNSGIGSNGLTAARHEAFHYALAAEYPESFDPLIDQSLVRATSSS